MNWTVTPTGGAALGSSSTTTGANGQTSNTVRFPTTASGAVQVKATLASDATKSRHLHCNGDPEYQRHGAADRLRQQSERDREHRVRRPAGRAVEREQRIACRNPGAVLDYRTWNSVLHRR